MKSIFTLLLLFCIVTTHAQWSNTTNQFYDSLHMPVCTATNDQAKSLVVKSYPDSGYFVIWEDSRAGNGNVDIYAQKLDKHGVQLWANNGVPIATGPDRQIFSAFGNEDYRNYGHACTDSSGGFYIGWEDVNVVNTGVNGAHRVCVQHTKADGTNVFPNIGYIVEQPVSGNNKQYVAPQLIPDGNKGFYIGYLEKDNVGVFFANLRIFCYREEGGVLKYYGGQQIDPDVVQVTVNAFPCGTVVLRKDVVPVDDKVKEFYIFPDNNKGCGIVWTFDRNVAAPNNGGYLVYNHLCRVKKDSYTTTKKRFFAGDFADSATQIIQRFYKKDSVVLLYNRTNHAYTVTYRCGPSQIDVVPNLTTENGGEGFYQLESTNSSTIQSWSFPKAAVLSTTGNADAMIIAVNERQYLNNTLTGQITRAYVTEPIEKYDSIPYQLASDTTHPYWAYNTSPPQNLNTINRFIDTVMVQGLTGYPDFTLASGKNRAIFSTKRNNGNFTTFPAHDVLLQEVKVDRINANSFNVHINTDSKIGVLTAREISTCCQTSDIEFDNPQIAMDANGDALFYIREKGRFIRVSPVGDSAKLLWGAAGKPIGNSYGPDWPFVAMGGDGTALVAWQTLSDIFVRHLDSLNVYSHKPPIKKIRAIQNNLSGAYPQILSGLTATWISFELLNNNYWTVAVEVLDNFNLGDISVQAYRNTLAAIRTYNSKPYLDRNYLINVQNNPAGAASVGVRLYFTQAEFEALKAADPTIISPANLMVIKQPSTTNAPDAYIPVAGEVTIQPTAWKAVDGGYYLEFPVSSFSNFFIFKSAGALPVTWVNITAAWVNDTQTTINWKVSEQKNVGSYFVQHSIDGIHFTNVCEVSAGNNTSYFCVVPAIKHSTNYYRVVETDLDGKTSYSKVVLLKSTNNSDLIKLYPNPAKDYTYVNITGFNESIKQLVLTNAIGAIVWKQDNPVVTASAIRIPLKNLGCGIYFIQIQGAKTIKTIKLIKQ